MLRTHERTRNQSRSAIHWTAVVALIVGAAAGCQSPQAAFDPFMAGRTTIPPPSTAAAPAGAAPYYPAGPAAGAPPTIYTPPGSIPAAVPATQNYLPRGGMTFPQSQASPAAASNTTLASNATAAGAANDSSAVVVTGQPTPKVDRAVKPASFTHPVAAPVAASPATPTAQAPASIQAASIQPASPNRLPPNGAAQPLATALRSAEGRAAVAGLPELGDFPRPSAATNGGFRANNSPPSTPVTSATSSTGAQGVAATQVSAAASATPNTTAPGYGYDEKYQRLQGKLEFSPSQQRWKLRYIPIDGETDTYGGSVVLPEIDKLQGFAAGDLVVVQGRLNTSRAATDGFSPPYLIERLSRQ